MCAYEKKCSCFDSLASQLVTRPETGGESDKIADDPGLTREETYFDLAWLRLSVRPHKRDTLSVYPP